MRPIRFATLLLILTAAVPLLAGIGADVTIPAAGVAQAPNDLTYRTELVITNHRDVAQYVMISFVQDGHDGPRHIFQLDARKTAYLQDGSFSTSTSPVANLIGALRIRALAGYDPDAENPTFDPQGQLEAEAFIVADRGRFASKGSSRQEVAGISSDEYQAEEAVFLGVRHSYGTGVYTNVGVVNLHPTQTETFYVEFQYGEPVAVVVPPSSMRQIRVSGQGSGGRYVRVYPEWAIGEGTPVRTTPWVAYASTVDMLTGDAFSGIRVPSTTKYNRLDD